MTKFKIHNIESAPEKSKSILEGSLKDYGMVPNLYGVLAESPSILEAYQRLGVLFQNSSFDNEELTVVWQTINIEHECHYCVPAHTAVAHMMKVDPALTEALRNQTELPTKKLQVLQKTTLSLVRNRGRISDAELELFYAQGYEVKHLLDIILGISQKVISNYTNHVAETPVDKPFEKFVWKKEEV